MHLLKSAARLIRHPRLLRQNLASVMNSAQSGGYAEWLDERIRARRATWHPYRVRFSLLTSIYERTPAQYFRELGRSVLQQTHSDFEWVVLAHGPVSNEVLSVVYELQQDRRVRFETLQENIGIIGAMKLCLDRAIGEYVVPLDADDLLTEDALACVADAIGRNPEAAFLYSDEDMITADQLQCPYFRSEWDPILNQSGSYIWHLCAFRRDKALELGVFADAESNWCHDWDTVTRFSRAGLKPVHIPEVLYHWRQHPQSTTNKPDPEKGSLASQRYVLQEYLRMTGDADDYEICLFPIDRGAPEWWVRRKESVPYHLFMWHERCGTKSSQEWIAHASTKPELVLAVGRVGSTNEIVGELAAALDSISGRMVVVSSEHLRVCEHCLEESGTLLTMHDDIAFLSGRIIAADDTVVTGGERFAADGVVCSDRGMRSDCPGNFALSLKQKSVDAFCPDFFVANVAKFKECLRALPIDVPREVLGAWLSAEARIRGYRVAYSPLISGKAPPGYSPSEPTPEQFSILKEHYPFLGAYESSHPGRWSGH